MYQCQLMSLEKKTIMYKSEFKKFIEKEDVPNTVYEQAAEDYYGTKNYSSNDLEKIKNSYYGKYRSKEWDFLTDLIENNLIPYDEIKPYVRMDDKYLQEIARKLAVDKLKQINSTRTYPKTIMSASEFINKSQKEFLKKLQNLKSKFVEYLVDELGYDEKDIIKKAINLEDGFYIDIPLLFKGVEKEYLSDYIFIRKNPYWYVFNPF